MFLFVDDAITSLCYVYEYLSSVFHVKLFFKIYYFTQIESIDCLFNLFDIVKHDLELFNS